MRREYNRLLVKDIQQIESIIPVCKVMDNKGECSNYRGINMLTTLKVKVYVDYMIALKELKEEPYIKI